MKFRKSGEEFSSCHAAKKIIKENELGENTKKPTVLYSERL